MPAMRAGAQNFLTKPVDEDTLFAAVAEAVETDRFARHVRAGKADVIERLATLTPWEREVFGHVVTGKLNKQIAGAKASAEFEKEHLLRVPVAKIRAELFRLALSQIPDQGLLLEFGTYKGDSINLLSKRRPQSVFYGFDSFQGLPEGWTAGTREGGLGTCGKVPPVRRNVELVPGFFEATVSKFLEHHADAPVAFAHIDCDLYSATLTVLQALQQRLQLGTVLVCDEYYNYADWQEGEYKAWTEFCQERRIGFRYAGYIRIGSQVCVQVTALPS